MSTCMGADIWPIASALPCSAMMKFVTALIAGDAIVLIRKVSTGKSAVPIASFSVSTAFDSPPMAPLNPSIFAAAISSAAPATITFAFIASKPSTPASSSGSSAFMPSPCRMVFSAISRWAADSPPSLSSSTPIISRKGNMLPCASRTLMPYWFMVLAAASVGAMSCSIAFLSAVPASLPVKPTFVSMARPEIRSAVLWPVALNAKPACLKPSERSVMLAALAFAPAASWSAISVACSPERPKAFSAPLTTCAAVAASVSAAAASCSVPLAASIVSLTLRPAFDSSSIAVAASEADAPGSVISLPSATAIWRI